jgi:hypothetical protein
MNQTVECSHPSFQVKTRAFINFPQVNRLQIKIKESTQLQQLSYIGISQAADKDIKYKTEKDTEFEWPSGSFYIHYPVKLQSVIGFGKNHGQLGKTKHADNFKKPAISDPNEDEFQGEFLPKEIVGGNNYCAVLNDKRDLFEVGNFDGGTSFDKYTKNKTFKEPIKMVKVSPNCVWLVTDSNKIMYKGTSEDYQFPNNESQRSQFKEFKLSEN